MSTTRAKRKGSLENTLEAAIAGRPLLTYREAGDILRTSPATVGAAVAAGRLVALGSGRGRRIEAHSLLVYVLGLPSSNDLTSKRAA